MNDDFEQELHELLQERGATPMQTPQAPPKVLRRARRRQLSTALVSGATAVAVIGGAILGAQALRGNGGGQPVAEDSHADSRAVVFNGYTVTYPYDWALQSASGGFFAYPVGPEQPVEGDGTAGNDVAETAKPELAAAGPSLQLSNLYPDHLLDLTCAGTDVGPAGVAVQVTALIDPAAGDGSGGLEKKKTCDDGSTLYAQSVRSGHLAFSAVAKTGSGAADADVQALFDAYDSIGYPSGDTGVVGGYEPGFSVGSGIAVPDSGSAADDPATSIPPSVPTESVSTVVAGGTTESGAHWVMTADPSLLGGSLEIDGMGMGWASAISSDGSTPPMPDLDASVMPTGGPNVVWGSVVGSATSVEVRPDGADAIDVPLLAAPAVTGIDRQYFLTELPKLESDTGTIVALGAAGAVVGHQDYDLTSGNTSPGYPGDCPPPVPTTTEPGGDGQTTGGCTLPAPPVCATTSANGAAEECPQPLPGTCPPVEAGGDKNSVNECIVCADVTGPDGTTSNTATNDCPPLPVCTVEPASDPTTSGPSGGGCVFFPPCPEPTPQDSSNSAGCADTPVACATADDGQTVVCSGGASSSGGGSDPATRIAVPVGTCASDDTACLQEQPASQATTGR